MLDALRGVAALLVFASHAGIALMPAFLRWELTSFNVGHVGVVLFFLISGYIIPVSLAHAPSRRAFWVRRIFRLFPLYWLSIGLTLLIGGPAPLPVVLANATMLQMFLGMPHLSAGYWTLGIEELFYLSAVLLSCTSARAHPLLVALAWTAGALLVDVALPVFAGVALPLPLTSYLAILWTGTLLAALVRGEVARRLAVPAVLLTLAVVTIPLVPGLLPGAWVAQALLPRVVAFGLFGAALLLRHRQIPRVLPWLGRISYSLYLLHPLVLATVPQIGPPVATVALWTAATIGASVLTYHGIEVPGIALGRRLSLFWSGDRVRGLRMPELSR